MIITPTLLAVALYAGLNGLILLWLIVHIAMTRGRLKISIGDAGNAEMVRAMRGQANFVEIVPYALIMMLLIALFGAPVWLLHALGLTLTVSRLLHARHFTQASAPRWQRGAGATLSLLVLVVSSLGLIGHALWHLAA